MQTRDLETRFATCPLCEAACGVALDVTADGIEAVRGDRDDPFSQGYLCPKAAALKDLHDDPDRVKSPLVRSGSSWREASWDEALDRAADGLIRVRRQHGRDAVAMYYGNPVAHNLGLMTHGLSFGRLLRTRNIYSASSADQLPQMVVALRMFGHLGLIPVPDLDRTDLFLIFGANPVVSNGSLMTAPNMPARLRAIRDRGGRVVVVDPRHTETAAAADEHVPIRPGGDALLLAAMLHVIFSERLERLGRFEGRTNNLERLRALVEDITPERAAPPTGVSPDTTRRLAREFAQAPRATGYGRVGLCTQRHGTLATWLLQALNLITGHLDEVGGMMLTTPAVDALTILKRLGMSGTFGRWRSRVRHLPEFGGEYPIATLADEINTDGKGRVRALITVAGNPVLSAPNGARLDKALGTLQHVVAIDPFMNETTRHAHVLLPPVPPLSRPHYDLALFAFAVRNVAKYSDAVLPGPGSERQDWEILSDLAARIFVPRPLRHATRRALRVLRPERLVDLMLRMGPYRLTLAKLREQPHGVDLGPLQPGQIAGRIGTRDGRIDIAPADLLEEARSQLTGDLERSPSSLVLIGRRQLRSNNSWMHNAPRLVKGPSRCTLLIHPADAAARQLSEGELAHLQSEAGAVVCPIEITEAMLPGVVCLPHGWGHDREGTRLAVAREHAGASLNDVTSERHLDTVSGTAAFNGLPVEVRRAPVQ